MKRIVATICACALLTGGLAIMAGSTQNIKTAKREIFYKGNAILENHEIFDVNGSTYVPLRALCESTRKEVRWEREWDVNKSKEKIMIENEQWDYPRKPLKYISQYTAIPDADTAYKVAEIMFSNVKIVDERGHKYYLKAYGGVEKVEYDEKYDAWEVPGSLIAENKEDQQSIYPSEIPTVIVLRKDNGEVIAFW